MTRCTNQECRNTRSHLRSLVKAVEAYLRWLDAEMKQPSSPQRGKRIAEASNALEMVKDMAKRFGLGKRKQDVPHGVADDGAGTTPGK